VHPAVQAGLLVVRGLSGRRGRKVLLAVGGGSLLGLAAVAIFMASTVGALLSVCQREARNATTTGGGGTPYVSQEPSGEALSDIPGDYLAEYREAAEEENIDWAILAAVGKVETDHGRYGGDCASSSAGAQGPMQFMPQTWAQVGIDGDGDGRANVCNYRDAIPSAASYLVDGGAPEDYRSALFQYNHAGWYVEDVLAQAERYRAAEEKAGTPPSGSQSAGVRGEEADFPGSSGGTEDPPQGWDLVDGNRRVDYELDTRFAEEFEAAADEWNELGAVTFQPSPSAGETDLVVTDGYAKGNMALTGSNGTMTVDPSIAGGATENARVAMFAHEDGHVIGFPHTEEDSVMNGPVITNSDQNHVEPTGYDGALYRETWGTGSAGGGGGAGDPAAGSPAVFPLPKEYFDDYSDDWGAARPAGSSHEGTDVFAPDGTPIYSITDGTVTQSRWNELGGWIVMVEAAEDAGPVKAGDQLYYAHQVEQSPLKPGDRVAAGDVIGKVGSTGEGPPGTLLPDGRGEHLHLGWYDPSMGRAEAPSGAMNSYPLLEWLKGNGGIGTGEALAPGTGSMPAYCVALGVVDFLGNAGERISSLIGGGGEASDPSAPPEGSATGKAVVEEAKKYLGTPYVLGGPEDCVPHEAMDCTCLTTTVFREFGYELPDVPADLMSYGEPVEGEPQAGDVLVWGDPGDGTGGHAAISMGNGQIIHANMATMDTSIAPMYEDDLYLGARRLVGD
jgi:cell wall-associated NlpC family hydrolase